MGLRLNTVNTDYHSKPIVCLKKALSQSDSRNRKNSCIVFAIKVSYFNISIIQQIWSECFVSGVRLWDFNMRRNSSVKAGLYASDSDRWYRRLQEVSLLDSKYSRVSADIHFSQLLAIPISLLKILLRWVADSMSSSNVNCGKCIIVGKVWNILASDFMHFRTFISGLFVLGTKF